MTKLKAIHPKAAKPSKLSWQNKLAHMIHNKGAEEISEILGKYVVPKGGLFYSEGRHSGKKYFTPDELYKLEITILKHSKIEQETGCQIWTGAKDWDGYGHTGVNKKQIKAHRASYLLHKGSIPEGMGVCHSCDIPACINSEHLWLGTNKDNQSDCIKKNRRNGEVMSKYKTHQIISIRRDYKNKLTLNDISNKYQIPRSSIEKICYRNTWKHIGE